MAVDDGDPGGVPADGTGAGSPAPVGEPLRLALAAEPAAVGAARRWVSAALRGWSPDGVKGAALVVSELVGNVVLHARTGLEVSLTCDRDRARLEVSDLDPTAPSFKGYGAEASTGRGLLLVGMLTDDWGVQLRPEGKTVWAELRDRSLLEGAHGPRPATLSGTGAEGDGRGEASTGASPSDSSPAGGSATPAGLVEVEILGFPLRLYLDVQEHNDALMREFALMADDATETVPARLVGLARDLQEHFAETAGAVRAQLAAAVADGRTTMDLFVPLPRRLWPDLERMTRLLDEADEFCVQGDLLTLASSPEVRQFRRWFADQVRAQVGGDPPTPWRPPV